MSYSGEYMFPPRPEIAFPREGLGMYETMEYACQAKKNGTCTLLVIGPSSMTAYDRHGKIQKAWRGPTQTMAQRIRDRLPGGWSALVGEALHSKVPGIRDVLYVFDVIALGGKVLDGTTFKERQKVIRDMFKGGVDHLTHRDVGNGLWIAKNYIMGFDKLYSNIITNPEDEGLVVKNPNAKLVNPFKEGSNSNWQAKCRKPTKNYGF
jgi:hypothetical protein